MPGVSTLAFIARPVVALLSLSTNGVLRLLRMKTEDEEEQVTEDEIRMMIDLGNENGAIDAEEKELLQNVFEFGDLSVSDAMTRVGDVTAIQVDTPPGEVLDVIRATGLSRFPVYQGNVDDIVGILSTRQYLLNFHVERPQELRALLRPAYFVPETVRADVLFRDMQSKKIHMAVVVDEYGGTEGIATLEDIVEELVGDIWDEHDEVIEEFKKQEDGSYLIACSADLDDMFDLFAVKGACAATTVSGWVMEQVGRVPRRGTTSRPRAWMSSLPGWSTAGSSRSKCGYCPRRSPRLNKEQLPLPAAPRAGAFRTRAVASRGEAWYHSLI